MVGVNRWLECEVSGGMFTGEFAVAAKQHDGRVFSLFASADDIRVGNQPHGSRALGMLRVTPIEIKDDLVLVALPQESLNAGRWVTVKSDQLKEPHERQQPDSNDRVQDDRWAVAR